MGVFLTTHGKNCGHKFVAERSLNSNRDASWAKKGFARKTQHRNTVARHDGIAVVMSFARSSKAPEARNVRLLSTTRRSYRATAFRFKRSEPTCMNGTSVKNTLSFNQPLRTFAVADVQRKLALTSLFLAPCVLSMVDSTSQPPITPEYANCHHVGSPASPL